MARGVWSEQGSGQRPAGRRRQGRSAASGRALSGQGSRHARQLGANRALASLQAVHTSDNERTPALSPSHTPKTNPPTPPAYLQGGLVIGGAGGSLLAQDLDVGGHDVTQPAEKETGGRNSRVSPGCANRELDVGGHNVTQHAEKCMLHARAPDDHDVSGHKVGRRQCSTPTHCCQENT